MTVGAITILTDAADASTPCAQANISDGKTAMANRYKKRRASKRGRCAP
jgi:hypothetical protein